jgi:hypothetical protein
MKANLYSSLFQFSAAKWMRNVLFEDLGIFEYGTDVVPKRRNYHYLLCNDPEERTSQIRRNLINCI